jgi:hypothetical protein
MPAASSPSMTSNAPMPMVENGLVESSPQEMAADFALDA